MLRATTYSELEKILQYIETEIIPNINTI